MAENYRDLWNSLGLDLKAHDELLDVLGNAYNDIYLSQNNRPKGMEYFDFVMSEVHGLRIKELSDAQKEGRKIIGSFCVFVPEEIVIAANGILVGLCAGAEFNFESAEKYLPRNICALIKSAFGFKLGKVCPYLEVADLIVGENTCDGKKKSYEIFNEFTDNLYIMDLPQMKNQEGKDYLKSEYEKFIIEIEKLTKTKITSNNLKKGIKIVNQKRKALYRLAELRKVNPAPISGLDALLINQISFYDDPIRFTESVNKLCDELEDRISKKIGIKPVNTPRLIISGCPMAVPNWKLPSIIESLNSIIVGEESCVGERGTRNITSDEGDSLEALLNNILERYFKIDCAVFTPNPDRLEHIKEMYNKYNADGVIYYSLQFCQPYQIESGPIELSLEKENIPILRIETDYSQEDIEQLKTRIEAFIERLIDSK